VPGSDDSILDLGVIEREQTALELDPGVPRSVAPSAKIARALFHARERAAYKVKLSLWGRTWRPLPLTGSSGGSTAGFVPV